MLEHVELRVPQFEHSLQRLQNLPRTVQGMLFHGFQWFSMVFRMMALQFLLVRFGSSHIRFGSFYLGRCFWCNGVNIVVLTVGSFWIVVACNAADMNQWQWKRMVLVVIHGNVVLGHPPTCSTLRCVKLFVRGLCKPVYTNNTDDHASVLIPPRLTSGLLFCECFSDNFQTDVQTYCWFPIGSVCVVKLLFV